MKALNYSISDELNEFDLICNSKREPSRSQLIKLRDRVEPHYQNYLKRFSSIHTLARNPFNQNESIVLRSCYQRPTSALDALKYRLISAQTVTFRLLCPYCLVSNHSTFDHYIPIEEQPVFGVLGKNLIPCCDVCNKKKLEYWKESNQRAIIHLYNDTIPNIRFLVCDLTFNGSIPVLRYRLDLTGLSATVALRVKRHFQRLDLLNRYNKAAPKIISDIHTDVESLEVLKPSRPAIGRFLLEKAARQQGECGVNYWGSLAYEALGASRAYLNSL